MVLELDYAVGTRLLPFLERMNLLLFFFWIFLAAFDISRAPCCFPSFIVFSFSECFFVKMLWAKWGIVFSSFPNRRNDRVDTSLYVMCVCLSLCERSSDRMNTAGGERRTEKSIHSRNIWKEMREACDDLRPCSHSSVPQITRRLSYSVATVVSWDHRVLIAVLSLLFAVDFSLDEIRKRKKLLRPVWTWKKNSIGARFSFSLIVFGHISWWN